MRKMQFTSANQSVAPDSVEVTFREFTEGYDPAAEAKELNALIGPLPLPTVVELVKLNPSAYRGALHMIGE